MAKAAQKLAATAAAASIGVLGTALPANASTGLFLANYSTVSSGNLNVFVTYACDGGGTGSVTVVAAEGLITVGLASMNVSCDGNQGFVAVPVAATVGSWSAPGTATESAVLRNAAGTMVAEVLPMNVLVV